MDRIAHLTIVIALTIGIAGCATGSSASGHPNQKFSLSDVEKRLKNIQPWMSKMEVMIQLGSPAQISRSTWVYLPSRSGFLLPARALNVNFLDGVYISHETRPIILGEQMN